MAETDFEEVVDFAVTQSGKTGEFVVDDDIQGPVFDIYEEPLVLLTAISFGPADDVCVGVNRWLVICFLNKLAKFVELALWVLVVESRA
jgi:hypothetical protein